MYAEKDETSSSVFSAYSSICGGLPLPGPASGKTLLGGMGLAFFLWQSARVWPYFQGPVKPGVQGPVKPGVSSA